MKKLLLFISALAVMNVTDAQSLLPTNGDLLPLSEATPAGESVAKRSSAYNPYGKSTGLSDTFYRVNGAQYDSLFTAAAKFYYLGATLPLDSGLVFGINASNWSGYAGRFKFNHLPDTTMKVIGVLAAFGGTYNMATTKTIDFKVWGLDTTSVTVTTTRKMKNRPGTALATLNRSIKNLGINNSGNDTIREHYFTTAASGINTNFFVGYEITYTWA
jgi:hypothetical protein